MSLCLFRHEWVNEHKKDVLPVVVSPVPVAAGHQLGVDVPGLDVGPLGLQGLPVQHAAPRLVPGNSFSTA